MYSWGYIYLNTVHMDLGNFYTTKGEFGLIFLCDFFARAFLER